MNFLDHKDLGNHLLQLRPKVVKHPVYTVAGVSYVAVMLWCLMLMLIFSRLLMLVHKIGMES